MASDEGPLEGVGQWPDVKLVQVWREFVWHCGVRGKQRAWMLTAYDRTVRDQLVRELDRRDITMPGI
jgi:hypothetical protein